MLNDQNRQTLQWCSIIFAGLLIDTVTFKLARNTAKLSPSLCRGIPIHFTVLFLPTAMSFESVSIVHCTILYYILYHPTFWQWKSFVAFSNQRWLGKSRTGGVDAKFIYDPAIINGGFSSQLWMKLSARSGLADPLDLAWTVLALRHSNELI